MPLTKSSLHKTDLDNLPIEIKYIKFPHCEFKEKNGRLAQLYLSAYLKLKKMANDDSTFSKKSEEYLKIES